MNEINLLRTPRRQRGVAMVLALLLAALAVSLVTSMYLPQQQALRALENQSLQHQARLLLSAALEDSRDLLRRDAMQSGLVTTPDGLWARPAQLPPSRFAQADPAQVPALSVRIIDAQSRYNLRNLAHDGPAIYRRVLAMHGLDPALAERTAKALAAEQDQRRLPIRLLDDLLSIPGYTPQAIAALKESVVILPQPAALNIHTASAELVSAVLGLSRRRAAALAASTTPPESDTLLGVYSEYFLVEYRLTLGRAALSTHALIQRRASGRIPDAPDRDEPLPTTVLWLSRQ